MQLRKIAGDEGVRADEASLALLAEAGDGSMRDALSIMDQAIASAPLVENQPVLDAAQIRDLMGTVPNAVFEELLESVAANNSAGVITLANRLLDAGNSPAQLARQLVRYLRNCVIAKIAGLNAEGEAPAGTAAAELLQTSSDERRRAARTAMLFTEEDLTRFLQVMLRTFDDLGFRQEQRFHFELGLLKLVHLQRLLPVEELLSQLPVPTGNTPRPTPPPAQRSSPSAAPTAAISAPAPRTASPFESDRNRKLPNEQAKSEPEITAGALALESARRPEPVAAAAVTISDGPRLVKPAVAPTPITAAPIHAAPIAVTPIVAPMVAAVPVVAAETQPSSELSVEDLQQLASDALANAKGHQSAADALSDATWTMDATNIRIQLAVSKTMLPVLINAEAEKIIRDALRANGAGHLKPVFASGATVAAAAKKPKKAAAGSAYSLASEHPIVQQAQKLFNAEIRNVIDLREKE
jgi:DNA polymerase-3 subunit gamma/tau